MKFNQPACKGSLADVVALASTYNPQTVPNSQNVVRPTQIQLCPWFIDWLKMKTFKQASDLSRTKIGKYFIDSADAKQRRWGFRPIG